MMGLKDNLELIQHRMINDISMAITNDLINMSKGDVETNKSTEGNIVKMRLSYNTVVVTNVDRDKIEQNIRNYFSNLDNDKLRSMYANL